MTSYLCTTHGLSCAKILSYSFRWGCSRIGCWERYLGLTRYWRKLNNDKPHKFYSSPDITWVMKLRTWCCVVIGAWCLKKMWWPHLQGSKCLGRIFRYFHPGNALYLARVHSSGHWVSSQRQHDILVIWLSSGFYNNIKIGWKFHYSYNSNKMHLQLADTYHLMVYTFLHVSV